MEFLLHDSFPWLFNRIASKLLALDTWGLFDTQSEVIPILLINFPELRSLHATALKPSLPGVRHELPSREVPLIYQTDNPPLSSQKTEKMVI